MKLHYLIIFIFISCNDLTPEEKLIGPDRNANEIHDEIDEYIEDNAKNSDEKKAMEIAARYERNTFSTYKNKKDSIQNTRNSLRALTCVYHILGRERKKRFTKVLESTTYKTKTQLKVYNTASFYMNGQLTTLITNVKDACNFKPEGHYDK